MALKASSSILDRGLLSLECFSILVTAEVLHLRCYFIEMSYWILVVISS